MTPGFVSLDNTSWRALDMLAIACGGFIRSESIGNVGTYGTHKYRTPINEHSDRRDVWKGEMDAMQAEAMHVDDMMSRQ